MAGGAFALAADPSLLAADPRHRGRLCHRSGAARRVSGFHVSAFAARLRRRQRHHPAQGARARAVEAGCSRPRGRRGQHALVREWRAALDQHRCRRFYQQSRRLRARLGQVEDALVLGAGGAARAVVFGLLERGIKRVHLANRTLERAPVARGSIRRRRLCRWRGMRSASCCRARGCW